MASHVVLCALAAVISAEALPVNSGGEESAVHTSATSATGGCLCVFDIDRTLTGSQNDISNCPRNEIIAGVPDYGKYNLTLSELAQGINITFCKTCFLGISSAGEADGASSGKRAQLLQKLNANQKLPDEWSNCTSPVSPLLLNCKVGGKVDAVRNIAQWYKSRNITIADADVYFFDDQAKNVQPFINTSFNARQIGCELREFAYGSNLSVCGGSIKDVVQDIGVTLCQPGFAQTFI